MSGYEIHHGQIELGDDDEFLGGARKAHVFGTMWHGAFESDEFRQAFLTEVARLAAVSREPSQISFAAARESRLELLADLVEHHLDVDALLELANAGVGDVPFIPSGA